MLKRKIGFTVLFLLFLFVIAKANIIVSAKADITIPKDTKVIGEEAFWGVQGADTLVIPEGTLRIESLAFCDCSLSNIFLPNSLEYISDYAFLSNPEAVFYTPENSYSRDWVFRHGFADSSIPFVFGLTANVETDQMVLSWTSPEGEAFAVYEIFEDGTQTFLGFTDQKRFETELIRGVHTYRVSSYIEIDGRLYYGKMSEPVTYNALVLGGFVEEEYLVIEGQDAIIPVHLDAGDGYITSIYISTYAGAWYTPFDGAAHEFDGEITIPENLISQEGIREASIGVWYSDGSGGENQFIWINTVMIEPYEIPEEFLPGNITSLYQVAKSETSITLTWAQAENAASYNVYWREDGILSDGETPRGGSKAVNESCIRDVLNPPYTITGLLTGYAYQVSVEACNEYGVGTRSDEVRMAIPVAVPDPEEPMIVGSFAQEEKKLYIGQSWIVEGQVGRFVEVPNAVYPTTIGKIWITVDKLPNVILMEDFTAYHTNETQYLQQWAGFKINTGAEDSPWVKDTYELTLWVTYAPSEQPMQLATMTLIIEDSLVPQGFTFSDSYKNGPYYKKLIDALAASKDLPTNERIVAVALSQKGYVPGKSSSDLSGGGSGSSSQYTEYGRYTGANNADWCASFVSWCAAVTGIDKSVLPKSAGAGTFRSYGTPYWIWGTDFSAAVPLETYVPQKGDIVLFTPYEAWDDHCSKRFDANGTLQGTEDHNDHKQYKKSNTYMHYYNASDKSSHVAIVYDFSYSDGVYSLSIIEGNHSNKCGTRTIKLNATYPKEKTSNDVWANNGHTYVIQMIARPNY